MKCPNCGGTGKEYGFYDGEKSVWKDSVCPTCNGTGKVEQTNEKQYIDISKITPDCGLIKSIVALHKKCKLKHKEGCFADTCEECLARTFNGYHNHLLSLAKKK